MENNHAALLAKLNLYTISKQGVKQPQSICIELENIPSSIEAAKDKKKAITIKNKKQISIPEDPKPIIHSNTFQASINTFSYPINTSNTTNPISFDYPNYSVYDIPEDFKNPGKNQILSKNANPQSFTNKENPENSSSKTLPSMVSHSFTSPIKSSLINPGNLYSKGFEWDEKINAINKELFGNSEFRPYQREIINAVLSQKDVFVIMPTGGGKSLTFQLPAVLSQGISIIIMPLLSLIYDQMQRLKELKIEAREMNSSQTADEQTTVYDNIITNHSIKILFITPEKLSQSEKLNYFLKKLEERNRLARFVIDEAHCVSQWGRDFRKDYLKLSKFRDNFPTIPILALTGTATQKVKEDVVHVMKMREPLIFQSSFNRPNLIYEVRPKTKSTIDDIFKLIKNKYTNESGLIYCTTKKDCQKIAEKLKKKGIKADFFHSEVPASHKTLVQNLWMTGQIKVLVATVAFGMGIDKQAVRYVIHYSLPKSLENYYQESGRAGRDGQKSLCVIYYQYSDKYKIDYIIGKNAEDDSGQGIVFHELNSMIDYCENIFTCRRLQQLKYFGEEFFAENCKKSCDNCIRGKIGEEKDLSFIAIKVVEVLKGDRGMMNTMLQLASFLKGRNPGKKDWSGLDGFGVFKSEDCDNIEKVIRKMVGLDGLREKSVKFYKGYMQKIELGPNSSKILNGSLKVIITVEAPKKKKNNEELGAAENQSKFKFSYNFDEMFPDIGMNNIDFDDLPLDGIMSSEYKVVDKTKYQDNYIDNTHDINNLDEEKVDNQVKNPYSVYDYNTYVKEKIYKTPNETKKNDCEDDKKLSDPLIENSSKYGKSGTEELYEEIYSRLNLVRSKIARTQKTDPEKILSETCLKRLCEYLPSSAAVHKDFINEIQYFKSINKIKEVSSFDIDLCTEGLQSETCKKRQLSPVDIKKVKLN
ncbi:hypothetical protein SteCoe_24357 [Stentor coeruleus]|uniref:ATP-dependent DNA helicase n=1 Tax=Stentor coeruleus TaxID=5963 RepID=A0A1R2BHR5_9CILI|nr:hypothetical protein SteCoe_24357 [Stentor coeruleus]